MAVLSLPLTFTNSFWTQDYRKGLEVLYSKLEQGTAENDEIVAFIRARAAAENEIAASLASLPGGTKSGFGKDDGASLLMTFRGLQAESAAQGKTHKDIANDLIKLVANPFSEWAREYKERLLTSKDQVFHNWLASYEDARAEVSGLRQTYLRKNRKADEAEDDAKFAPNNDFDKYTTSPRLGPRDARSPPQRTASVSDRIAARFRDIQRRAGVTKTDSTESHFTNEPVADKPDEEKTVVTEEPESIVEPVDKGKGKAVESPPILAMSPPPMSPPLPPPSVNVRSPTTEQATAYILSGVTFSPRDLSQLLFRAAHTMPLRPKRFPVIGEYQECFTGDELVAFLVKGVPSFEGDMDRAEEAAKELCEGETLGVLRRLGEFGNEWEAGDDAWYQFRNKAFNLDGKSSGDNPTSPGGNIAGNLFKRSNNLYSVVQKALATNPNDNGPTYVRLRQEADEADQFYRVAVRKLDRQRLGLEERIEELLKTLQKWELERLRAIKTALLQYQGTLANQSKALEPSRERSSTLISAYIPESDLSALIERYRTGPFHPVAHIYESVAHDESDAVFGIDLRKWAEGGWDALTTGEEKKDLIPPVLTAMLGSLQEKYASIPNDDEKRKAWIYDVPLPAMHHLRESLNAIPPGQPFTSELLDKYDTPILAGTVKLWTLELNPPLVLWEGWDDIRKIYPIVGSGGKTENGDSTSPEQQRIQDLQSALLRLPKVHLYVLDALVSHLKKLIDSTKTDEANNVYVNKLALSVGRTIIHPKQETHITIQDRHPTLLFMDLIEHYDEILPPTITKKKRESERRLPVRKRTAPIDMRMSRARVSVGAPSRDILAAQQQAQQKLPASAQQPSPATQPLPPPKPVSLNDPPVPAPPPVAAASEAPAVPLTPTAPPAVAAAVAPTAKPTAPEKPKESSDEDDDDEDDDDDDDDDDEDDDDDDDDDDDEDEDDDDSDDDDDEEEEEKARPTFKEPPPENDPPRPSFNDPPPEASDAPESKPLSFVTPPMTPVAETDKPSSSSHVSAPTAPQNPAQAIRRSSQGRPASPSLAQAAVNEDQPLVSGKSGLSRHGSGQNAPTGIRGPRISRGPRAAGGGSVSSMVSNFNNRATGAASPPPSPGFNRLAGQRPSSRVGSPASDGTRGTSARPFSTRTMASDAEDEVVDR